MESFIITRQHNTSGNVSFTIDEVIAVAPSGTAVFCYVGTPLGGRCDFEYGNFRRTGFELTQDANTTLEIATTTADVVSRTLDRVNYDGTVGAGKAGTWPGVNAGYSYELKPDKLIAKDNDDGDVWCETTGDAYHSIFYNTDIRYDPRKMNIRGGTYLVKVRSDYGTPNAANTCP
jgi:hypothetical protein